MPVLFVLCQKYLKELCPSCASRRTGNGRVKAHTCLNVFRQVTRKITKVPTHPAKKVDDALSSHDFVERHLQ